MKTRNMVLLLVSVVLAAPVHGAMQQIKLRGLVTDSMCGAKHMISGNDAACARKCIKGGSHYALLVGEKLYSLTGQEEALEKLAGEIVYLEGTMGSGGVIQLVSVEPAVKGESVDATKPQPKGETTATQVVTIQGLIRDVACPIQNKKASARVFNLKCAMDCAKLGSPLVLLTDDGSIYTPISSAMPDEDQRARLMPLIGKYVQIRGQVYERQGTHAIVIQDIKELPEIHLVTDAH